MYFNSISAIFTRSPRCEIDTCRYGGVKPTNIVFFKSMRGPSFREQWSNLLYQVVPKVLKYVIISLFVDFG